MAEIRPIRALRYDPATLEDVVAPPYDVIGPEEREKLAARSPHNIVHLDLPEGEGDERYANAARLLAEWRESGALQRDETPCLFRYEQEFVPPEGGAVLKRRGLLGLVRAEAYDKRVVLPHERTLSGPKEDRYKLFRATSAALSPVFLLFQDPSGAVNEALDRAESLAEFRTKDAIIHRLARISDADAIASVVSALEERPLLIADGHHRYETALRYRDEIERERKERGQSPAPNGGHQYVLAFLSDADDPGLVVFPTHRLVHRLESFDKIELLARARETFEVRELGPSDAATLMRELAAAGQSAPSVAACFADGSAAILSLRGDVDLAAHPVLGARADVLRRTDVVVLHGAILEAILGITPEKQASQTHLVYLKSASEALLRVRRGDGNVLFLMNGTPVADVRRACEAGEVMPQKSTYFYPKVLTGLAIHAIDPDEAV